MPWRAVLFDLDGTLVDTAPDFVSAANALRAERGLAALAASRITPHVSNGSAAVTAAALDISPSDDEFEQARADLLDTYKRYVGRAATIYPALDQLLTKLGELDIPWGIVTNKPLNYTTPLLEQLNLAANCSVLICPDHVKQPKPSPEGLLLAAQKLKLPSKRCIYIGDHQRDIEAGKAAQMSTIAVGYGYLDVNDNPHEWQATHYAKTPQALSQLLLSGLTQR